MYTDFYNLTGRPFQLTPDPRFYFDTRTHRKAMAYLTYGLNQGEGFIIITGDIGAGKTTLVGHLFDQLDEAQFVAAKVVTTQLDADNTLRMVANAFGIESEGLEKSTLLTRIESFLHQQFRSNKRTLLIVDEVQNLPISALEELRMLSNFQSGQQALLQIFLLGQPEFRNKLAASEDLEQLRQRVIATHHLEPMGAEEVGGYVQHRMALCGWEGDPEFTKEAYQKIYDFTGGVPRRLNTLCARLLLFGALEELHVIDAPVVEEVINDLKKDNTPTTGPKHQVDEGTPLSGRGPLVGNIGRSDVPPKMRADQRSYAHVNGHHGSAELDQDELFRRLDVLEKYVKSHDRTIRKTLDILTSFIEADAQDPQ
ncbi:MAG: XrtA/PEP-CTERM system-associated ATPase [Pseudomonadota bacterium]